MYMNLPDIEVPDKFYGTVKLTEYETPRQNETGEWVYLYTYDITTAKISMAEWLDYQDSINMYIDLFGLTYHRAFDHIKEAFDDVEFRQREAGSIKCWQITLPERDDDLLESEIIRMKLMFG